MAEGCRIARLGGVSLGKLPSVLSYKDTQVDAVIARTLQFLRTVDVSVPAMLDMHLVMDSYGTHKAPRHQELVRS
jgi:hypothetical protein